MKLDRLSVTIYVSHMKNKWSKSPRCV